MPRLLMRQGGTGRAAVAKTLADRVEQVGRIDRLPEHAREARGIDVAALTGDEHDGNGLRFAMGREFALDIASAETRQAKVEDYQRGGATFDVAKCFDAVFDGYTRESANGERVPIERAQTWIVLHDQDNCVSRGGHGTILSDIIPSRKLNRVRC